MDVTNSKHDDSVIIEFMESFDLYMKLHDDLYSTLKEGHLQFSKARFSMGSTRLSTIQFPSYIRARLKVELSKGESTDSSMSATASNTETATSGPSRDLMRNSDTEEVRKKMCDWILVSEKPGENSTHDKTGTKSDDDSQKNDQVNGDNDNNNNGGDDDDDDDDDNIDIDEEIRRELNPSLRFRGSNNNTNKSSSSDNKKSTSLRPGEGDPLKWFGLFTPQALKQCQAQFKQSVHLATQLAQLRAKLIYLVEEIEKTK